MGRVARHRSPADSLSWMSACQCRGAAEIRASSASSATASSSPSRAATSNPHSSRVIAVVSCVLTVPPRQSEGQACVVGVEGLAAVPVVGGEGRGGAGVDASQQRRDDVPAQRESPPQSDGRHRCCRWQPTSAGCACRPRPSLRGIGGAVRRGLARGHARRSPPAAAEAAWSRSFLHPRIPWVTAEIADDVHRRVVQLIGGGDGVLP